MNYCDSCDSALCSDIDWCFWLWRFVVQVETQFNFRYNFDINFHCLYVVLDNKQEYSLIFCHQWCPSLTTGLGFHSSIAFSVPIQLQSLRAFGFKFSSDSLSETIVFSLKLFGYRYKKKIIFWEKFRLISEIFCSKASAEEKFNFTNKRFYNNFMQTSVCLYCFLAK